MKVKVEVVLDIDPEAWALNYGVEGTASIRMDVREWAQNLLHAAVDDVGVQG